MKGVDTRAMHLVAKFLVDLCILIYLCVKAIIYAFIPNILISKDLKDETVLITGGGNGVGQQLAVKLSGLGCRVIVWDVNEKGGQKTVKLIKEKGGKGYFYLCDVSRRKEIYMTAEKVKNEIGEVTVLINNAGIVSGKSLLNCSDESIEKTFQVNALSHFWTCRAFLPDMISKNHGHIVNVSSIAGFVPLNSLTDYCSSKSAVVGFHESLYVELKRDNYTGIKTTLVCPFHINTSLFKGFDMRLLPTMEPEYVADKIISSVRSNREIVVIPEYLSLSLVLKSMFPMSVTVKVIEMLNGFNAMENVTGSDMRRK